MTAIGERSKKWITIQYPTKVSDGAGGFATTWNDLETVQAKKTTHRSDEAVQAMATTGTAIHNFRIRYRTDIKSSWKIRENGKLMNIIGPPILVREGVMRYLDVVCKEAA